jgi:hypothetical protein
MFRNQFFRRIIHQNLFEIDQVKLVYFLGIISGLISKSRIYATCRELLVEFSEE